MTPRTRLSALNLLTGVHILLLGTLAASIAPAHAGVLEFMKTQRDRRYTQVPREVLAFYYTWYGRPERHGRWVHWARVRPEQHDIGSATHYPARGAYDSHDPALIDWHIDLAKAHGVTGFIATWWGQGTFDDRAFRIVLDRAERKQFKVTVYWETAPGNGQAQIDRAVNDLSYILREYGGSPAFLKVNGKPVIFVYGRVMGQVPMTSWPAIIQGVRQRAGDCILIADGYQDAYARLFDGVHTYNICGWVRGKTPEELREYSRRTFADSVALARRHGRISCLDIIPGYDDTKIRKPGLKAERQDGQTYRVLWEEAIRANPDWILITSWNEWHEGSEIEPSWEHGDKYIRLTGEYAPRFLAKPPVNAATSQNATLGPEAARRLQRLFGGRTIGLLPDFGGEAPFFLLDAGLHLQELTWEDVVNPEVLNPKHVPVVLHAGSEHFRGTVRRKDDVIESLQRYLKQGGFLVSMPYMPFPFYYDDTTGRPVQAAHRVGLPVTGGWEQPPPGVSLSFEVDTGRLPGLPTRAPFPDNGDLRWRPASASVARGQSYHALARLTDASGKHHGDGIAYVEWLTGPLAGGRTLYVWMRMADALGPKKALPALWQFIGQHLPR